MNLRLLAFLDRVQVKEAQSPAFHGDVEVAVACDESNKLSKRRVCE